VVDALKTDTSLEYDIESLGGLLTLDYPSYKRHERWYRLRKMVAQIEGESNDNGNALDEMIESYTNLHV
jgi:hypothetical protein